MPVTCRRRTTVRCVEKIPRKEVPSSETMIRQGPQQNMCRGNTRSHSEVNDSHANKSPIRCNHSTAPDPHSFLQSGPLRPCLFNVRHLHYGLGGHLLDYANHIYRRDDHHTRGTNEYVASSTTLTRIGQNIRSSYSKPPLAATRNQRNSGTITVSYSRGYHVVGIMVRSSNYICIYDALDLALFIPGYTCTTQL
jgi:hypothetical protein